MSGIRLLTGLIFILLTFSEARKHKLVITEDDRKYIAISTFGFYKGGILSIELLNFETVPLLQENHVIGFSLDKSKSDAMNTYLDSHQDTCLLQEPIQGTLVYFVLDIQNKTLSVKCSDAMSNIHIYKNLSAIPSIRSKRESMIGDSQLIGGQRRILNNPDKTVEQLDNVPSTCNSIHLPLIMNDKKQINTSFVIFIASEEEEGLYNLYLHNCLNYNPNRDVQINFTMYIEERNMESYLSAGEMPLPALYLTMSLLYCLSGSFWFMILKKSSHPVYKIHYLMAVLVYIKSLALLFHSINYHFLQTKGEHVAAWAILYYITHVLKGLVLFITLALIGTGWTFIKHILSSKEKRIFMFVIPLQVLANVAQVIIEESEEGDVDYRAWKNLCMFVDLFCCGLILFPVVWSIRHLQEASQTDGKAAMNLRKLKLFRHFYIMIVSYIYFTRIIVYLIQMTIPFQYEWLDEMFKEMATYAFFVLTAYKFQPTSTNPYFQLDISQYEDDEDVDIVISECPMSEGLSKLSRVHKKGGGAEPEDEDYDAKETSVMLQKRESSHEYD